MKNYSKAAGRAVGINSGFGRVNTSHPGQNMGLTLEDVKSLVDNAQKVIGIQFTSVAGTTTPNIQIPATAKYIVGFCFAGAPAATDIFTLTINNEQAISNGSVIAYQANTGKPQIGYYDFFRPVAGATAINLAYTSLAGGAVVNIQLIYV